MSGPNLSLYYEHLVDPSTEPPPPPDRRNITLRLPHSVHRELDAIRLLARKSKTVVAEEILIAAVADMFVQMQQDERLEDFWQEVAEAEQEDDERRREEAEAMHGRLLAIEAEASSRYPGGVA